MSEASPADGPEAPRVLELPRCSLLVLSGPERGREKVIEADLCRIGKARDNDLVLDDETVSRSHCEIVREPRGYLLRDLGSTNGTLLDGAEIKEAWLKPGAVITVGKVELKVRPFAARVEVHPSSAQRYGEVVGASLAMRQIFGLLERVGPTDAAITIEGEPGTGKRLLARSIHQRSPRRQGPFVTVDCGAAPGSTLQGALFGHAAAGSGARAEGAAGAFERAHGGTLLLHRVVELPLELQPKVLRAIEQRSFRRLGDAELRPVDIRVIATSERSLEREVARGKFQESLYFRLGAVPVELPPLRERRQDLPLLVQALLARMADGEGSASLPDRIVAALAEHDWPGNVRELQGVLSRLRRGSDAAPAERGDGAAHAPAPEPLASFEPFAPFAPFVPFVEGQSYRKTKAEWEAMFERRYVAWLLDRSDGNISAAARAADMDRKYLTKLVRRHGLHPKS